MDTSFAIVRRLIGGAGIALFLFVLFPRTVNAASYGQVMAQCQQAMQAMLARTDIPSVYKTNPVCQVSGVAPYQQIVGVGDPGHSDYVFFRGDFTGPVPGVCSNAPTMSGSFAGKILMGYSFCNRAVPAADGSAGMVSCSQTFTPSGPPTMNQWGTWTTPGTLTASGDTCDGSGGSPSGNGWSDRTGTSVADAPPADPTVNPPVSPPPKLCGGGSCYDPTTDQFCATSGGQQFCVSGSAARSGSGGCASSGDSALCAGSPTPPKPDPTKVPDPPTAILSSDQYTQADPTTGASQVVKVNSYTNQGATPSSSGQSSGDKGPAPASSSPSSGSYSDGGDCNSPPVCSGDAVMCGIARETWRSRCSAKQSADQLHKDLVGDGPPQGGDPEPGVSGNASKVWSDGTGTGDAVADAANQGNYDTSGLGFGTACPLHDMTVPLPGGRSFDIKFSTGCELGGWLRAIILAFAFFAAAKITAGGSN